MTGPARAALAVLALLTAAPARAATAYAFEEGVASWYGDELRGRPTASGEPFDPGDMTAAHRTLPFGTILLVTNRDNGRQCRVRVNDRGPFVKGRVIDCAEAAAEELGFRRAGLAQVTVEILGQLPDAAGVRLKPKQRKRLEKDLARAQRRGRHVEEGALPVHGGEVLVPVDPGDGQFEVQVGAFRDHGNADRLAARLADRGWPTRFAFLHADGLKRVRVGPWPDLAAAERAERRLADAGMPTFLVRADLPPAVAAQ